MTDSSSFPVKRAKPERLNISEATKKGNNDGTTTAAQRFRPFKADLAAVSVKRMRHAVKMIHKTGMDSSRIYMVPEWLHDQQ